MATGGLAVVWTTGVRLLVCGCGTMLAACGSQPLTAPSAPPGLTVTVTGPAVLTSSQTAQLTATTGSGQDVTAQAAWGSSDGRIAAISSSGLLTVMGIGTATITGTYQHATGRLNILVNVAQIASPSITTCGNIVASGAYVVANDISQSIGSGPCLTIPTSGVHLDCRNHTVSGVQVYAADTVTVTNCTFAAEFFTNNSTNMTFENNHAPEVVFRGGHNNQLLQNTIDGGYDGSGRSVGQDDGILLVDEVNDTVQGNAISNVYDAGIEGVDVVMNTVIANNTIVNAGFTGIGGYWCTSWAGNTISGNSVSRSPVLLFFNYNVSSSLCANPSTVGGFANNRVVGNRLGSQTQGGPPTGMLLNFLGLDTAATTVYNNLIQGNDLGTAPEPILLPLSGFVNGGGNTCTPAANSSFCGG